jgi:GTP-binding protein
MKVLSVRLEKRCLRPGDFPAPTLPEVAFAGRSNVGKSSLINGLLWPRGLAKVSSRPGKTRAIDFFLVNDTLRLVDLPGYGYAEVPDRVREAWKVLIEAYLMGRQGRVRVVWILDIRREPSELDRLLQGWLASFSVPYVPVLTKADKLAHSQQLSRKHSLKQALGLVADPVLFSARTGLGKDELWKRVKI